nr:MazG nucleotide pyrophosphohydrolase domain-containing protein [Myxococcota bacterium]
EALRDELGDLLLQVVFHAQMAREAGDFEFADVVRAIADKLVRRHPHVFGDADVETATAQTRAWEGHKAAERAARARARGEAAPGALDDVPLSLPSLTRAGKLQRRATRAGLAAPPGADALERAWEAYRAARGERGAAALGALLFALVADADRASLDPDRALREANAGFEARCRATERGEEPTA